MKTRLQNTNDCTPLVKEAIWEKFPFDFTHISTIDELERSDEAAVFLLKRDYVRKFSDGTLDEARTARTIDKWDSAEKHCFLTNQRIGSLDDFKPLSKLLKRSRDLVASVIGLVPPSDLFGNLCRFTGGASYSTRRGVHYTKKMACLTVTHEASFFLDAFSGICNDFIVVPGNRMCAVPKTKDIDRLIAIEPSGNAFLQQAVGRHFKHCLKTRVGIDLYDQRPNQSGAFHALVDGLATLDLECASDTVSVEIVRAILPPLWFRLLDELRCKKTCMPSGSWRYLDKFSSMGNGFTFELETLIFWALCKIVVEDSFLLVYGDDIVIPSSHFETCTSLLEMCGFIVNPAKSFSSGPYYESCGHHYFNLDNVTPAYQKEPICDVLSAMRAHNRLVRWALRGTNRFPIISKACRLLRKKFGYLQCKIPYGAERDDAWLYDPSLIMRNRDGDFKCLTLHQPTVRSKAKVYEQKALAYKLYKPDHQNENPKGYVEGVRNPLKEISVKKTLVWVSSLETR